MTLASVTSYVVWLITEVLRLIRAVVRGVENNSEHSCPVCLDKYSSAVREVRTSCGHSFCDACLQRYAAVAPPTDECACPLCRSLIQLRQCKYVSGAGEYLSVPLDRASQSASFTDHILIFKCRPARERFLYVAIAMPLVGTYLFWYTVANCWWSAAVHGSSTAFSFGQFLVCKFGKAGERAFHLALRVGERAIQLALRVITPILKTLREVSLRLFLKYLDSLRWIARRACTIVVAVCSEMLRMAAWVRTFFTPEVRDKICERLDMFLDMACGLLDKMLKRIEAALTYSARWVQHVGWPACQTAYLILYRLGNSVLTAAKAMAAPLVNTTVAVRLLVSHAAATSWSIFQPLVASCMSMAFSIASFSLKTASEIFSIVVATFFEAKNHAMAFFAVVARYSDNVHVCLQPYADLIFVAVADLGTIARLYTESMIAMMVAFVGAVRHATKTQ